MSIKDTLIMFYSLKHIIGDARSFFKEILQEIGFVMRKRDIRKQKDLGEYFIIPIYTGLTYAFCTNVLVQLKPLDKASAFMMFFDKYDYSRQTHESAKEHLKQNVKHYWMTFYILNILHRKRTDVAGRVSKAFVISLGSLSRLLRETSRTSIGDVERAGFIFLTKPTKTLSNNEFNTVMPFMLMKILNKMLLSFPEDLLLPDELFLIPTKDRPWRWQDFESLHGYYQRALIKSLINVRNAKIMF
ncbi:19229_t:CDS:2 [Funneliformis geosporum]|nr:19229_t:CDS:2 [Funneliformis geosporum]